MKTKSKKAAPKKTSPSKKSAPAPVAAIAASEPVLAAPIEVSTLAEAAPETNAPAASDRKPISREERRRLIELVAYRRAERLGFGKTNPVEDWLVAEREIDAMLA